MEKINVVYITDERYAMPTCISVYSLTVNKACNDALNIYIICDEVSDKAKKRFLALSSDRAYIDLIDVTEERYKALALTCLYASNIHVTATALFKLNLPDILQNEDKVVYVDGDTLIQKSLYNLYNCELNSNYVASVNDMMDKKDSGFSTYAAQVGLRRESYFNSGVMLLNLEKMREDGITRKLLEYRENGINYYMDQDAFNIVLGEKRVTLPYIYNFLSTVTDFFELEEISEKYFHEEKHSIGECIETAVILHFAGGIKPWEYNLPWYSSIFFDYYNRSPYAGDTINLKSPLKALHDDINRLHDLILEMEYVVPYEKIKRSSRLILYGAGRVGKAYYKQLLLTQFCTLVAWVDQQGSQVDPNVCLPSEIIHMEYDYLLIAIISKETASEVRQFLVNECAVDKKKILDIF